MATLQQIVTGIESRVSTAVPELNTADSIPDAINPPAFFVGVPPLPSYRATFGRGKIEIPNWPMWVFTSAAVNRVGQELLAQYLDWQGPKSIILALETEPTLGGLVDDLIVESSRPLGLEEVGIIGYYGAEMRIRVEITPP